MIGSSDSDPRDGADLRAKLTFESCNSNEKHVWNIHSQAWLSNQSKVSLRNPDRETLHGHCKKPSGEPSTKEEYKNKVLIENN